MWNPENIRNFPILYADSLICKVKPATSSGRIRYLRKASLSLQQNRKRQNKVNILYK